jgi:hypothetical protein
MAAIDSLLKLVEAQKADALIVASEQGAPAQEGGADVALSMPKVSHDMVSMFLEDLVDRRADEAADQAGRLRSASHHSVGEAELLGGAAQRGRAPAPRVLSAARGPSVAGAARDRGAERARRDRAASRGAGRRAADRAAGAGVRCQVQPPPEGARAPVEVAAGSDLSERTATDRASRRHIGRRSENAGDLIELVLQAHRDGASDVLLSAGLPARVRLGGRCRRRGWCARRSRSSRWRARGGGGAQTEEFERSGQRGPALDLSPGPGMRPLRFRVNVFRQQRGLAAAVRPVRSGGPGAGAARAARRFSRVWCSTRRGWC